LSPPRDRSDSNGEPKRVARVGRAPMVVGRQHDPVTPRHRGMLAGRSALITVMINAVMKASRRLRRDFGEIEKLQVSEKGPGDFVSLADKRAEETLLEELMRTRPGFGFVGEEGSKVAGDGQHRFIVDPLDGTTNFLHGIPHFAISVGLEKDGEVIAGVIYEPIGDELYWAEKGKGAFLDTAFTKSLRLRVSGRRTLANALIGSGIPFRGRGNHPEYLSQLGAVMGETAGVRRFGSAALDLAFVAAGRLDAFWENGLAPWDIAAGVLMVKEAGGFLSEIGGKSHRLDSPNIIAANGHLGGPLGRLLRNTGKPA
jgi:myo-inositol-1(or 4)-monophosphatase